MALAMLYFIYRILYESLSIYIRVACAKANPSFLRTIVAECYRNNKKSLKRDFWSLNFPLAILMLVGFISGLVVCYFLFSTNMLVLLPFGFVGAFTISMFYMPFFYTNLDTLYEND